MLRDEFVGDCFEACFKERDERFDGVRWQIESLDVFIYFLLMRRPLRNACCSSLKSDPLADSLCISTSL